jgi:hypothetical protein
MLRGLLFSSRGASAKKCGTRRLEFAAGKGPPPQSVPGALISACAKLALAVASISNFDVIVNVKRSCRPEASVFPPEPKV